MLESVQAVVVETVKKFCDAGDSRILLSYA